MDYLSQLAEPDTRALEQISGGPWDYGVCLPALREGRWLHGLLRSLDRAAQFAQASVLAIVVVNNRESAPEPDRSDNLRTLAHLSSRDPSQVDVVAWDRCSVGRGLGSKDGVGTARKIGSDALLALWKAGRIRSSLASTTDGDARVEEDYFLRGAEKNLGGLGKPTVGLVHRFRHEVTESPEHLALTLYELYLRHYVLGLRWAKSPYAFHTIGSLLGFDLAAYERCRGFPRRQAGEDFYLLDKLAKVGAIAEAPSLVRLEPRPSDRVPFGTGAAMARIDRALKAGRRFRLFPDSAFRAVRLLHETIAVLESPLDGDRVRERAAALGPEALASLGALGFFAAADAAARTRKTPESYRRHLLTHFGSLKTFQWIRALADGTEPPEFREGLRRCEFLGWEVSESQSALSLLERLRKEEDGSSYRFQGRNDTDQAVAEADGFWRTGIRTVNRLPLPGSLST